MSGSFVFSIEGVVAVLDVPPFPVDGTEVSVEVGVCVAT